MASEALKQAMAMLAASDEAPELSAQTLAPSKLGTKEHWDSVYQREVNMFNEIGDEGEVWFGEDAAQDMVDWAEEHFPDTAGRILDVGTGNGQLLFAFSQAGYTALTGIDYSSLSIQLAESILKARTAPPANASEDDDSSSTLPLSSPPPTFFTADILEVAFGNPVPGVTTESWDLITDKGTYDAVCLSDEQRQGRRLQDLYVEAISKLLPKGNWTQTELEKAFVNDQTGLVVHSTVPRATFEFGGAVGSSITTIAFEKQ
ncbi:class I SAM-dependent methyltransferase [Sporobolomyces koalae]|uniref:class I SAM-dependent methyltransferase n=1 Tax=Sporobolomyces koalae TaxID=500713 RepID=UPI00317A05B4